MKFFKIILIILIILNIIIAGCIFNDNNKSNKEELEFEVNYKIDLINNNEITIFLPVLVAPNGELPDLNNNLKIINGNPIFKIQESIYGMIINITCNQSTEIGIKSQDHKLIYIDGESKTLDFSTRNGTKKSYFCFLKTGINISEKNIYLNIHYKYHYYLPAPSSGEHSTGSDVTIKIVGYLRKGWNELEGEIIKKAA